MTILLITINPGLEIYGLLPAGRVGDAYSATIGARGGTAPYALSVITSLPAGLTATDNGDGTLTIAGTPSEVFSGSVTVRVRDAVRRSVDRALGLTILPEFEAPSFLLTEDGDYLLTEDGDRLILE